MTWAIVNSGAAHTQFVSSAGPGGTTPSINTTGADLIVIHVSHYEGGGTVATPTDSKSNTWHKIQEYFSSGTSCSSCLFYATAFDGGFTVGSGHTFTYTQTGCYVVLDVVAFSGSLTSASPLDTQTGNKSTSATSIQPGSVGASGELIVTGLSHQNVAGTASINLSFAIPDQAAYVGGTNMGGASAWLAATGAANPTWTLPGTVDTATAIASFKAAAAGFTAVNRRTLGPRVGSRSFY